jgi:peptide/nickel transport system substrate-binding protein
MENMRRKKASSLGILGAILASLLIVSLACSADEATPARQAPAPTAVPAPTTAPTGGQVMTDQPQYGGHLRIATNIDMKTLDAPYDNSAGGHAVEMLMYGTLVDVDQDLVIIPQLAESWNVSSDGKTITFNLVKGATFHDGTDFTAQAVKWHFDRVLDPDVGSIHSGDLGIIDNITVQDSSTITFYLTKPSRVLMATLTAPGAFITSPTAVLKYDSYSDRTGDFGRNPVGLGPFRFEEWVPDSHVSAVRFENYFEPGKPYLDKVTHIHINDANMRLAMVRTGEAEIYDRASANDIQLVKDNPDIVIPEIPRGRINFFGISTDKAPYDNKALRQAMAYAVDRQSLVDTYYMGEASPAYSPIGYSWAYNPDIKILDFNIEKGKQKMTEAGYPNGIDLNVWTRSSPAAIELTEMFQAHLSDVGIRLNIIQKSGADYWPSVVAREALMVARWRGPRPDPALLMQQTFHSKGSGNPMKYNNPEVDRLLDAASQLYDIVEAKKLYNQAQRIITEDVFGVWTVYTKEFTIMNKKVQGYEFIPDLYTRVHSLWFK